MPIHCIPVLVLVHYYYLNNFGHMGNVILTEKPGTYRFA